MIFDCVFLHRDVLETVTSLASPRQPPSRALPSAFPLCHPSLPPRTALGVFPNGGTSRLATTRSHTGTGAPGTRGGVVPAAVDIPPELGHHRRGGDGDGYVAGGCSWPEETRVPGEMSSPAAGGLLAGAGE